MISSKRSLVGRLVLSFSLPSFVVLLLVVGIAYSRANAALREEVFEKLEAVAAVKQAALDAWIDHLYKESLLLSGIPDLVDATAVLADDSSTPREREAARSKIAALFHAAAETQPSISEIFLLSPAGGEVLVSTQPENVGQYRIYDRYYEAGKLAPFIQNVYPSPITLKPTVTLSAPIRDASGALQGVFAVHLSLDYLDASILQRTGLGRSGVVTLVDRHKVFVSGQHYGDLSVSKRADSRAIDEVVEGRSGSGIYPNLDATSVIGVYRWLESRELGLIVEMEEAEALEPARRLAGSIFAAGIVFLAVLILGTYLMARRIARPILSVAQAADRVSQGKLDTKATVRTDDEIGALARSFNGMVEQLAGHYAEMSEKILQLEQAENALHESLEELKGKNDELRRFNYTVSHDLKSPLVTIKGFLGFVEEELRAGHVDDALSDIERISEAADRMHQLLNDLLALSRIGRAHLPPEPCPLEELAREAVDSVAERTALERAEITIDPALPVVLAERGRFLQVFENLIGNALKYMGTQPSPRVEVGMRRNAEGPVVFVRDNGAGIDPAYHEKVFGLFERLSPDVDGTGVGLAIVQRIVESYGGRVWVESEGLGRGSTFCFTLPGGEDEEAPA